ncbi:DUF6493 family protein [Streptomyces roseofulvus]|uniref:DUF6493 family protein n=3 Tax=Streptomyces TaxID=1883 RepID=A0ABU4K1B8_9ACTN|nr:DUF6493 family protein [Streptomyces roseolus]
MGVEMTTAVLSGTSDASGVDALMKAVRAGRAGEVPVLLEPLDASARAEALRQLKALRSEVRSWDWNRWEETARVRRALYVAGAGCHTGAAAAASWLGGRDLLSWRTEDGVLTLRVLLDRTPVWRADVAHRLAAKPTVAEACYGLIRGLVENSGATVPATDGYVLGWARQITDSRLLESLRADPQTPVLVAHALAMQETPDQLASSGKSGSATHWPTALAALVSEGVLDRAETVDLCVSRLLRGGRQRNLRFSLALLQLVPPNAEERRERIADWIGMTANAVSPVAGYAQKALSGLALEGALPGGAFAEMTAGVLFRTEKKLLRAQLSLVNRALAKNPALAAEVLPVVADAFGHDDSEIQERALRVVARHLKSVDEETSRGLSEAASLLGPAHRSAAEAVFGSFVATADQLPYEELLPPVPEPEFLPGPEGLLEELMEDLLVQQRRSGGAMEFERALDGLVRHAHQDRDKVAAHVRESFADAYWYDTSAFPHHLRYDYFRHGPRGMEAVLASLVGKVKPERIEAGRNQPVPPQACVHRAMEVTEEIRIWEVAHLIGGGTLPLLLSTPTRHTGGIDPLVLVGRLREYADAGLEPAPVDLGHALLRVRRQDPSAAQAAEQAEALGSEAGARLAAWLRSENPLVATVRFRPRADKGSDRWWLVNRILVEMAKRPEFKKEFPKTFHWLAGGLLPNARGCYHWEQVPERWATLLPADRELLAAFLLSSMASAVDGDSARDVTGPLTLLAEGEGQMGRAVALVLAFGLGCRDADDRLRAVDALLVLAARGELDARQVGRDLAWLLAERSMKPNRLADAARTAAATGAYGTVWTILSEALPALLEAEKPMRGLGELLAIAADCVERCGATGELSGLERHASARGTSQLVTQSKRLLNALRQKTDQGTAESP